MNRKAYAFLFSGFSFLSLYLVSGAMIVFLNDRKKYKSTFIWLSLVGFILLASLLTSARTGMALFIVAFGIFSLGRLFMSFNKGYIKILFLLLINGLILVGTNHILSRIRMSDLTSDSGRMIINKMIFNVFKDNPLVGIGFGISSYENKISTIPYI